MVLDVFSIFNDKKHPQALKLKLVYGVDLALLSREVIRHPLHLREPERGEICIVSILERWFDKTRDSFGNRGQWLERPRYGDAT